MGFGGRGKERLPRPKERRGGEGRQGTGRRVRGTDWSTEQERGGLTKAEVKWSGGTADPREEGLGWVSLCSST